MTNKLDKAFSYVIFGILFLVSYVYCFFFIFVDDYFSYKKASLVDRLKYKPKGRHRK